MNTSHEGKIPRYRRTIYQLFACVFVLGMIVLLETCFLCYKMLLPATGTVAAAAPPPVAKLWLPPLESSVPAGEAGELVRYGRKLISNTSEYFGPKGSVAQISNGMNCQNCHLAAGTLPYGNNYSAVASTYPKFRARSNSEENIIKRISDCFERSLNGRAPDSSSREMAAIKAYMQWLGAGVKPDGKPEGAGLKIPPLLERAANPAMGKAVYMQHCQSCHGAEGEGLANANGTGYTYPPLWGRHSYNDGAGLYRLSNFAAFVKHNMPLGVTFEQPLLTTEEAWDVAAFINSQPRPHKEQQGDWHNVSQKPFDLPFGPYADGFSETQHKYGPFGPIKDAKNQKPAT